MSEPQTLLIGSFDNDWYSKDKIYQILDEFKPTYILCEASETDRAAIGRYGTQMDNCVFQQKCTTGDLCDVIDTLYAVASSPQVEHAIRYGSERLIPVEYVSANGELRDVTDLCEEALSAIVAGQTDEWVLKTKSKHCAKYSRQQRRNWWRRMEETEKLICSELSLFRRKLRGDFVFDNELYTRINEELESQGRVAAVVCRRRLQDSYIDTTLMSRLNSATVRRVPLI